MHTDEWLTGTTALGQSGPGSNVNERVLHILKRSSTGERSSGVI